MACSTQMVTRLLAVCRPPAASISAVSSATSCGYPGRDSVQPGQCSTGRSSEGEGVGDGERLLPSTTVGPDRFSGPSGIAPDPENVVGDLVRDPELLAERAERAGSRVRARHATEQRPHLTGGTEQHRGFLVGHPLAGGQVRGLGRLQRHVRRLPVQECHQRTGQLRHRRAGGGIRAGPEVVDGQSQQAVAGQERRVVAGYGPRGRASAPGVVLVQDVVVQQGELVDELDGHRRRQRLLRGAAHRFRAQHRQQGPKKLAAAPRAHRVAELVR